MGDIDHGRICYVYREERDTLQRQLEDEKRRTSDIHHLECQVCAQTVMKSMDQMDALKAKLEAAYDRIDGLVKRCDQIGYEALQDKTETGRLLVEFRDRAETAESRLAEEQSEAYRQRRVHGEQINEAIKMREAAESRARELEKDFKWAKETGQHVIEKIDDARISQCDAMSKKIDEANARAEKAESECARLREALEILGAPDMWLETRDGNLEWRGAGSCADPMEIAREALQSTPTPSLRDEAKRWRECLTCELRYRDDGDNQCPKCRRKKGDGPAIIPSSSHG